MGAQVNMCCMRASLGQLAELPMAQQRRPPDHADLRRRMPLLKTPSADLIRDERDER